jgi:tRNA 2-selenouridine synthase
LIGQVSIPDAFYTKMRDLPVYFLDVPLEERTKHLVTTYASLSHDQLADAISRIAKRLGYDNAKFAQEELEKRNYYKVVEITLLYYDKYYLKGLQNQDSRILEFKTLPSILRKRLVFNNKLTKLKKMNEGIKLTSFSHGAGCGCKLSPY